MAFSCWLSFTGAPDMRGHVNKICREKKGGAIVIGRGDRKLIRVISRNSRTALLSRSAFVISTLTAPFFRHLKRRRGRISDCTRKGGGDFLENSRSSFSLARASSFFLTLRPRKHTSKKYRPKITIDWERKRRLWKATPEKRYSAVPNLGHYYGPLLIC